MLRPDLREILGKALAPRPQDRYASCGELRDALGAYMGSHLSFTSERALREFLVGVLADAREDERPFISHFAHITPADVRDMTRRSQGLATSLVRAGGAGGAQPLVVYPGGAGASGPGPASQEASSSLASSSPVLTESHTNARAEPSSTHTRLANAFFEAPASEPSVSQGTKIVDRGPRPRASKTPIAAAVVGMVSVALVGALLVGRTLDEEEPSSPEAKTEAPAPAGTNEHPGPT